MDATTIFALQSTATIVVYALIARWHLWPRLARLPLASALIALLWIHTLRTLGMTVLVPGVADPKLPRDFSVPLAYGDLLAAALAFVAILALRFRWPGALALVWLMNLEGTLDLLNATYQGIVAQAASYQLGAAWLIPTYFVPALWVTHVMMFIVLLTRAREPVPAAARA